MEMRRTYMRRSQWWKMRTEFLLLYSDSQSILRRAPRQSCAFGSLAEVINMIWLEGVGFFLTSDCQHQRPADRVLSYANADIGILEDYGNEMRLFKGDTDIYVIRSQMLEHQLIHIAGPSI
ncbi:hypothetical protein FPOAC2_12902 [Fusarium poae]